MKIKELITKLKEKGINLEDFCIKYIVPTVEYKEKELIDEIRGI